MNVLEKKVSVKRKNNEHLSYKYQIILIAFALVFFLAALFVGVSLHEASIENQKEAGRDTSYTAGRIVNQVDERLGNLWQYYISTVSDDAITWMLEHEVHYSDYNEYSGAQNALADNKIFGDYIDDYTLVNFKTKWVLCRKGMFPLSETVNESILTDLYEKNNDQIDKHYWFYDGTSEAVNPISKNYRLLIETNGLNFVLKLPCATGNTHGMLLVNVNMNTWQKWISSVTEKYEHVMVVSPEGDIVLSQGAKFDDACIALSDADAFSKEGFAKISVDDKDYVVSVATSKILGWKYYVIRDLQVGAYSMSERSAILYIVTLVLVLSFFFFCAYLIYHPIGMLVKNISDEQPEGNEIVFLKKTFEGMKLDKEELMSTVSKNRDKVLELFELRLIRGEVRNETEWNDYASGLSLELKKYFAAAVMVLKFDSADEVNPEDSISEDSICIRLVEELPKEIKALTWMPPVYNACTISCLFGDDDEDTMLKKIMKFYEAMQSYTKSRFGLPIQMGVSATHTELRHISAAYRESINALAVSGIGRESADEMYPETDFSKSEEAWEDCHFYLSSFTIRNHDYNASFEKEIVEAIKAVDKDRCYQTVDEFATYLSELSTHDEFVLHMVKMLDAILGAAVETNLSLNVVFPDGIKRIYQEVIEIAEAARARRFLKANLLDPIIRVRNERLETNAYSLMEQVETLIKDSCGDITLTECADALHVHPTYIWKLLKMERGKSFSDYVEAYKLEEAKRLLLETDLSVNDIAARLSYTNAQNFIRFFNKGTGLTPGKFRKLY